MPTKKQITNFTKTVWKYYVSHKRDLPWRKTTNPYRILVSEIMLQQTQVSRVIPKYKEFLKRFPTPQALASADLREVLSVWQGLGYNRRAMYLQKCAKVIVEEYKGKFPRDFKTLCSLPGIGPATAGDILAFAWNIPTVVIETNIRSVYIHFFFPDTEKVSDTEILPLIEATLDTKNPREWYWALFDYGSYLKETHNPSKKSSHYSKPSTFKGSNREKRGMILKILIQQPQTQKQLEQKLAFPVLENLHQMVIEGLLKKTKSVYMIK